MKELSISHRRKHKQMAKVCLEKFLLASAIRKMQIEIALRFHLKLRRAVLKKTNVGKEEKEESLFMNRECKLSQPLWKSAWRFKGYIETYYSKSFLN